MRYQERQRQQTNENHHIDNDSSNADDRSTADDMYHTNTEYEHDNESANDNEIYFAEKDFCQPTGIKPILYGNSKTDDSEYETDDDEIPPLEPIPTMTPMTTAYLSLSPFQMTRLVNSWLPKQPLST